MFSCCLEFHVQMIILLLSIILFMYLIHLFSFDFIVIVYFPSEQDSFNFLRCILD